MFSIFWTSGPTLCCLCSPEIYEDLCVGGEEPDLLAVLTVLASIPIPGLPPGGGIQSK